MNKIVLYLDSTIRIGIVDNNPANISPAPTATNKDGNAQQIKVPKLVNKLKELEGLKKSLQWLVLKCPGD